MSKTRCSEEVPTAYGFGHNVLYQKIVKSLTSGDEVEIPVGQGRLALEVLHMLYSSVEKKTRVYSADYSSIREARFETSEHTSH